MTMLAAHADELLALLTRAAPSVQPLTRAADMDVEAWNAANPTQLKGPDGKWADVPGTGKVSQALSVAGLFRDAGRGEPSETQKALLRRGFEGTFGGFSTRDLEFERTGREVEVTGQIYGPDGAWVGGFFRVIGKDRVGKLVAEHRSMEIKSTVQGHGFAKGIQPTPLCLVPAAGP